MLTITLKLSGQADISLNCPEGGQAICPAEIHELSWIQPRISGLSHPQYLRLTTGNIVMAHSSEHPWMDGDAFATQWPVRQYYERFAGRGQLRIEQADPPHRRLCEIDITVCPSKLSILQLQAIFDDLQRLETGLVLDMYAKTDVALEGKRPVRTLPPEVMLAKASQAINEIEIAAPHIVRRPYHSTREVWEVRPYRPGQTLRPQELTALCDYPSAFNPSIDRDPDRIRVGNTALRIEWVPTTELVADYDIYEHRAIKAFLEFLARALRSLAQAARDEHDDRNSLRARANTWWPEVDAPRLPLLLERELESRALALRCAALVRSHAILSRAGRFKPPLRQTAAFTRLPAYRRTFAAMRTIWRDDAGAEVRFAAPGERFGAQDVSKLFEYWGTLAVLDVMRTHFHLATQGVQSFVDTRRFVTTLRSGAEAWFRSADGRLVRVRYEPFYKTKNEGAGAFGRLGNGALLRPDLTMEIYKHRTDSVPQTIIVTDFKYRRAGDAPHPDDITKIRQYMDEIADLTKAWPRPLPRHGWIIYPSDLSEPFSDFNIFDPTIPVGEIRTWGAIPTAPGTLNQVLERTVLRLLELEGIRPTVQRTMTD